MLLAQKTLFRQFTRSVLPLTLQKLGSSRSFSKIFTFDSAALSNLQTEHSVLVCRDAQYNYFQEYFTKHLPPHMTPILVPFSAAAACRYVNPSVQAAFDPLQRFILESQGSGFPHKYCQNIMFSPITTSTQTVLEEHYNRCEQNLIYFAASMTQGRGRANNKWESHSGGLMFSYTTKGKLADCVYLPYLDSLCLVKAIKPYIPDIMIKWPNDIYVKGKKVAGIICNAARASMPNSCPIVHGIGINFSNKLPTACLIQYSKQLTIPKLLDSFHRELNYYLYVLEHEGFDMISREYQEYWMHGDYKIDVFSARGMRRTAKVVGISPTGNLELQYLDTGEKAEFDYKEYGIDIERACIKHKFAR